MTTREVSLKQEQMIERAMDHLGARRTPNSGAGRKAKGDLQDQLSVIEAKTMMKTQQQFTIKKEDIDTLEADRRRELKQFGFLMFDFGDTKLNETYVTMKFSDFLELYETYLEYHELL